ncbi:class II aldolase/adducin N-terminal [Mycena capillaripes]|nr:class II aldolase/adducin N-terminal [Mycena capillaripes]
MALGTSLVAIRGLPRSTFFFHVTWRLPLSKQTILSLGESQMLSRLIPILLGFLERCIHSEIYRQFEDVEAVVHFHSPDIIPFGLMPIPFKPVYHMASFLGSESPPIFDISESFGPGTDMLIRNTTHGAALATSFTPSSVSSATRPLVLMRGHGATLTAGSLKLAVYRAVYTQNNAKILTSLSSLAGGAHNVNEGARFLSAEECEAATLSNSGQVERAWQVWCKELED